MDEELDSMGFPNLIRPRGVSLPQDTRALSWKKTGSSFAGAWCDMDDEDVDEVEDANIFVIGPTEPLVQEPVEFLSNLRYEIEITHRAS